MHHPTIFRCVLFTLALALLNPLPVVAWSDGQAADIALGQDNLTASSSGNTANRLFAPFSGCIDPTTQDLWVVVYGLHRVVKWTAANKVVTGSSASVVLGQPDFATFGSNTTASGLYNPTDCAFDAQGNLYVSDRDNNRVLGYSSAATKPSGASADLVLGQADFTSGSSNRGGSVAANTLYLPYGVAVDLRGNLWVCDRYNHRVLRYDDPMNKTNGADADFVLGQANFTSGSSDRGGSAAANTLDDPHYVAVDENETVVVSDNGNHRVLKWSSVYSKANGAAADTVFGQANFTASSANRGGTAAANTLSGPYGVAIDTFGGVYISDSGNNRILYYNNGVSMANGDNATNVLGQPDFVTTANAAASATSLGSSVFGTVFDEALGRLWVVSYSYHRVTSFYDVNTVDNVPPTMPTVTGSATTTSSTPTWNWTANGGGNGTYRYKLDDTDLSTGATTTVGTSYTSSPLPNGAHTLYVQERDNAGNWSTSGSFTTTINAVLPSAPTVTGSATSTSSTPTWNWTANGGGNGTFRYKLDDTDLTSGATTTTGSSYTPASPLPNGAHTLYVQERDVAGNWSTSGSFTTTINAAAPVAPTVTGDVSTQNTMPTWNWSPNGGGNGTFRYKLDDSDLSSGATETTATTYTPATDLSLGTHTLYVQERDAAANWSASGSYTTTISGLYYSLHAEETRMQETGGSGATTPWGLLFLLVSLAMRQYSSRRRG